jgi:hypothetical protein
MAAKRKYRWEKWFGQRRTVLVRGVDYECSQSAMVGMIRSAASRRYGVRVSVVDRDNTIDIEVVGDILDPTKIAVADQSAPALAEHGQVEGQSEEPDRRLLAQCQG